MEMRKISNVLTVIELIVLICIIFVAKTGVIRIALFVFLMPILLINGQMKKQMFKEEKEMRDKDLNKTEDDKKDDKK